MTASRCDVLIVDDDPDAAHALSVALTSDHVRGEIAPNGAAALAACRQREFDVVVSDIRMPDIDGIELMARFKRIQPDLPIVLVTGRGTIPAAVEAMKLGAYQYVTKPCDPDELREIVSRAAASRPRNEKTRAALQPSLPRSTEELVGTSAQMVALRARVELVASARSPVLITGETGTGKELIARAIHASSPRRRQPFVTVNASAIPEALLESEMFGHVRGAFTNATQTHRGYFGQADGGTLLLDEIGDMPLALQAKLLRVLQAGEVRAVGGERVERVDVRILAATHQRLPDLVKAGRFREDLYYRLNVISITVPPLRERRGDVAELSRFFLARAREDTPRSPARSIGKDLADVLENAPWPGNVRELESMIERLVVLAPEEVLTPSQLLLLRDDEAAAEPESDTAATRTVDELVRRHVEATLARTDGNKARAAKALGIDLSTLYRWQQKWRT